MNLNLRQSASAKQGISWSYEWEKHRKTTGKSSEFSAMVIARGDMKITQRKAEAIRMRLKMWYTPA
jgi:hypothetical protein